VNGTQLGLTIVYGLACIVSVAIFVALIRSTRARRRAAAGELDTERLAHGENRWGLLVVAFLVIMLAATIWQVPYGATKSGDPRAQRVDVTGQQFGWTIQPNEVRAGVPVQFRLSSRDVQHGFGVYDGNKFLFQVQVPAAGEHVQYITRTFSKPGVYQVLCLEFCGFQHHLMKATFRVKG